MSSALSGVKCTVNNCTYWENNNRCTASTIEVNMDSGVSSPRQSDQTNCHTFKSK